MANDEEEKRAGSALVVGGGIGVLLGTFTALMLAKPAAAAPPELKLDYLTQLLEQLVAGNLVIIDWLQKINAAQIVPGVPGVPEVPGVTEIKVTVITPWVAQEPQQIFNQAIRSVGVFISDIMVDWTKGKRLILKAESSLDQAVSLQPIGNISRTPNLATNIGLPVVCPANGNSSIGLAWGDWQPYIGIRITVALLPTVGILNIWAVIQE